MLGVALCAGGRRWAAVAGTLPGFVVLAALIGAATTLVGVRAADDPIARSTLPATDYHAVLEDCAPAWNPADRNIHTTDGSSLNDVDRATRTAFVNVWQVDAWPRWRWEADCLGVDLGTSVEPPAAAAGAAATRPATLNPTRVTSISPTSLPASDYREVLDRCTPVWDPADRNIYTTDGASLNDVDRATRTAFVNVWQIDAWPRWRWEADCLGVDLIASVEPPAAAADAPGDRPAALNPTPVTSISPASTPPRDYRELLDSCAVAWNPADRNIHTRDGYSLNDVDRATRTLFVTVWQVDAWPRWRWEAECLGASFTLSVSTTSAGQATLTPTSDSTINPASLSATDYREILDHCAPAWDSTDRNIYTADGLSLNDVDRATRTSFVTVWQVDAWPRWRWEVNCLQTTTASAPATAWSGSTTILGTVRTTYDPFDPPRLPVEVYLAILGHCAPAWDPTDRNIYTTDGLSLNDVDRATRSSFVTVWQVNAWPRWRWEVNCLQAAFTPGETSPAGAVTLPGGAVTLPGSAVTLPGSAVTVPGSAAGSPGSAVRLSGDQEPAQDPTTHPVFPLVYQAAVARGADDALAQQVAIQVVTEERFEDFLNGTHEGVLYGEYECTVRSTACPLVPQVEFFAGSTSSSPPSTARQVGDYAGGTALSSTGRFAGYHMPICRPNDDGTSTCHVNPDWPVLEYRNGDYFRCKSLSSDGRGVGCVPY